MRILRAIIEIAALPMLDIRQQLSLCHAVASQLVGDQDARYILQTLQQPSEEAPRRPGVAAALHQDIEHDAMLSVFLIGGILPSNGRYFPYS